ncbi:MAG: IS1595 family transposase, partial [Candidatus Neptunochlamydia sp.]|nr:IS1595 family transposase [Candidatus Neptunochlamydia sp.]
MENFSTQKECVKFLEKNRWGDRPKCAYCESDHTYQALEKERHHCNRCHRSFSVTVGTIFHGTKVPLQKWFLLIALMLNAKKGLSACQAARDLGMRRTTVWSMMHRIRKSMKTNDVDLLKGIVEADETYVGGKPRRKNNSDDEPPKNKRGRGTNKECVIGIIERNGSVVAQHQKGDKKLEFNSLKQFILGKIDIASVTLMTDDFLGYKPFSRLINHKTVNHSTRQYVCDDVHTNTIESFWAILKIGIKGQFHHVSAKYLHQYLDEFCWKLSLIHI